MSGWDPFIMEEKFTTKDTYGPMDLLGHLLWKLWMKIITNYWVGPVNQGVYKIYQFRSKVNGTVLKVEIYEPKPEKKRSRR